MSLSLVGCGGGSVGVIGASGRTFYNALVVAEVCACKGLNRNDQEKRRLAEDMLLGAISMSCRTFYNALAVAEVGV